MIAKNNVLIDLETSFGVDLLGQRCRAKTRQGTPCQLPANSRQNGRCRSHGGGSTGPKTADGRASIAEANLRYGKFIQAMIAEREKRWNLLDLCHTTLPALAETTYTDQGQKLASAKASENVHG